MDLWAKWSQDKESRLRCDKSLSSIQHVKASLKTSLGIYMIFLLGLTVSFLVFIVELLWNKFTVGKYQYNKSGIAVVDPENAEREGGKENEIDL